MQTIYSIIILFSILACTGNRPTYRQYQPRPLNVEKDIADNSMKLFCAISFAPAANSKRDDEFEKKYGVKYFIVGDYLRYSMEEMKSYNLAVATALDKNYGKEWRQNVRNDTVGL